MDSELPDLDENVAFIVENGASVGPLTMRAIVASVTAGERSSTSLVWWAGATDWVRFEAHSGLREIADLDEAQPEPAQPEPVPGSSRWGMSEAQIETAAPEGIEVEEAMSGPEPAADHEPEPVALAEPEPAAEHAAEPALATGEAEEAFTFNLPTRASSGDDELLERPALTGLFSSGARTEPPADEPDDQAPSPDALDAILAARQSLESVGARIEALSSATRRSMSPEDSQWTEPAGVAALEGESTDADLALAAASMESTGLSGATEMEVGALAEAPDTIDAEVDLEEPEEILDDSSGEWTSVSDEVATEESIEAEPTPTAGSHEKPEVEAARAELTARFDEMVRKSISHQRRIEWIMRVDELLLSSCITAIADSGFTAIDLNSHDSDHRVLFDHNDDSRRVRLELSPVDMVSEAFGRHVRFALAWGRDVPDPDRAFEIVRQETLDAPVPPGVVTSEANLSSATVSTRVELILAADDFVRDDYSVDRTSLDAAIAATLHALESHWHQLFD